MKNPINQRLSSTTRSTCTIAILLTLTTTALCEIKNGCTERKCLQCAQSTVPGSTSNRYCNICKDSVLKIVSKGAIQYCDDDATRIEHCRSTAFDTGLNKVACHLCKQGYSIKTENSAKVCHRSTNGCYYGNFIGAAERCDYCDNKQKLTLHVQCSTAGVTAANCPANNKVYAYKCEDGGTEIVNCRIKHTSVKDPTSENVAFSERCEYCDDGFTLAADFTCVRISDQMNKVCRHKTAFTDNCSECDWLEGFSATNYHSYLGAESTAYGTQVCYAGILSWSVVALLFGFLGFRL